jgi:hypothetical protein
MPSLLVTAMEEIKRLREQLIECDDEIRDLRYRVASARLQSHAVVKVVVPTPRFTSGAICLRSSNHFPPKLYSKFMKPDTDEDNRQATADML